MFSNATLSPKTKGVPDPELRAKRLEAYQNRKSPTVVDFKSVVSKEKWTRHWANREQIEESMREAQILADEIKKAVECAQAER